MVIRRRHWLAPAIARMKAIKKPPRPPRSCSTRARKKDTAKNTDPARQTIKSVQEGRPLKNCAVHSRLRICFLIPIRPTPSPRSRLLMRTKRRLSPLSAHLTPRLSCGARTRSPSRRGPPARRQLEPVVRPALPVDRCPLRRVHRPRSSGQETASPTHRP